MEKTNLFENYFTYDDSDDEDNLFGIIKLNNKTIRSLKIDKDIWLNCRNLSIAVGYKDTKSTMRTIPPIYIKYFSELVEEYNIKCDFNLTYNLNNSKWINTKGAKLLITKSKLYSSIEIAKKLDIDIDFKYNTKEQEIIKYFVDYFETLQINYELQYIVYNYRIDCYLPELKIAIEIDEFNHQDRNLLQEKKRENIIKEKLNCIFFRFNPDEENFSIFKTLGKLQLLISQKNISLININKQISQNNMFMQVLEMLKDKYLTEDNAMRLLNTLFLI